MDVTCPTCNSELLGEAVYCHQCGASVRRRRPPVRYAGFWRRVAAVFIDLLLLAPVIMILRDVFISPPPPEEQRAIAAFFSDRLTYAERQQTQLKLMQRLAGFGELVFFVCGPYYVIMECSAMQGTLGKRALGLRVTDLNGRRIRPGRAIKRYLARMLSAIPWQFGFIMAGFTAKKQGLHDILAGTLVVIAEKTEEPEPSSQQVPA